jgi:hypothetical protein
MRGSRAPDRSTRHCGVARGTIAGMFTNLNTSTPISTSPVPQPYRVRLHGLPDDEALVWVLDDVLVGDRRIVRSAHGEGFWHIVEGSQDGIPLAVFQDDDAVSFQFPAR